jgi:hypothetical protein
MTTYPSNIDDDSTLTRVDDNITEIGEAAINQLRSAVFAIEKTLGTNPHGSLTSLKDRLAVSINNNGTIKASALTAIGLVTLPITNVQVATNAAIDEIKLNLNHTTNDLHTLILGNAAIISALVTLSSATAANLLIHINGGTALVDGTTLARHVASQIELNTVPNDPSDPRAPTYTWTGLLDKDGILRGATEVATALLEINNELNVHENATANAHPATAITVDTSKFQELPLDADTVQKALDAIDDSDTLLIGTHRANMHSNGVPQAARSVSIDNDGYSRNVVPETAAQAFLVAPPGTVPVDDNADGDDLIVFKPDNTDFVFDAYFSKVKPGDLLTINYGNGISARHIIDSKRHLPGTEWVVRLNSVNLYNTDGYDGYARIDRPFYDINTAGVLAPAAANNNIYPNILGSVILGSPRGANALGLGFEPGQLDANHYKLYLQLYPSGDPLEYVINLQPIDVTGNAGITPGKYTLESIVASTNDALRKAGYNHRFIAYEHDGEFGIMLADSISNASFSIISGLASGAVLSGGTFSQNVIGDAFDGKDALGLGRTKANVASAQFVSGTFSSVAGASNLATNVIVPLKRRNYIVNGAKLDKFVDTYLANKDGYWEGDITNRVVVGVSTVEVTYTIPMCLEAAGLAPGKTIVIQPEVSFTDPTYRDVDYGRFIIKEVVFPFDCSSGAASTVITVVNGLHNFATPLGFSTFPTYGVRLYFSDDSVGFNKVNIIDAVPSADTFNRFHEIFVNDEGKTHAHERARMPHQEGSGDFLETRDSWTIKEVSPKLKGFIDPSATDFKRYVRFYVLNYDTSSGEYDGYIGQRTVGSPNITNMGVITRARKNIPARFYDNTNVDFIELQFSESAVSTGTNILPTSDPKYVDIEIFDGLRLDEELFFVASCEVDSNIIQCVKDRREFGNVNEKNLSNSAKRYIEAGDRHLHSNGIFRGLSFSGTDPLNPGRMFFDGGVALVNGRVVTVNNGAVEIPQVSEEGAGLPDVIDWAVCINEDGAYETIIITPLKTQFFGMPGPTNYYLPSVTFAELITTRKDLTLLAVVTVTIASITINKVADARRFIDTYDINLPFTLIDSDSRLKGNFNTSEQLLTWLTYYEGVNSLVKVKGVVNFSTDLILNNLSGKVIFDGDGTGTLVFKDLANFIILNSSIRFQNLNFDFKLDSYLDSSNALNLNIYNCNMAFRGANKCINIASNVLIEDTIITSVYGTGNIFTAGQRLNQGGGTIYSLVATTDSLTNVKIKNCEFIAFENGGERFPFINIELEQDGLLDGFYVNSCKFIDDRLTPVANQTNISIIGLSTGGVGVPVAANVYIENNYSNLNQGIYIVSESITGVITNMIYAVNCNITGNQCGVIGYSSGSAVNNNVEYDGALITYGFKKPTGLLIDGNSCNVVYFSDHKGINHSLYGYTNAATGHVKISNNNLNFINTTCINDTPDAASLTICNNNLHAFNSTLVSLAVINNAIAIGYQTSLTQVGKCVNIINNIISSSNYYGFDLYYNVGIFSNVSANIKDNTIKGFVGAGINIFGSNAEFFVTGNDIRRDSRSVLAYVAIGSNPVCTIIDNEFDDFTIDGLITTTISGIGTNTEAERNKNQTVTDIVHIQNHGNFSLGILSSPQMFNIKGGAALNSDISTPLVPAGASGYVNFVWNEGAYGIQGSWITSIADIIPHNTRLIRVDAEASSLKADGVGGITNKMTLGIQVATSAAKNAPLNFSGIGIETIFVEPLPTEIFKSIQSNYIYLIFTMQGTSGVPFSSILNFLTVTYRW